MPDSPGIEALFVRLYLDRHIMGRLAVDLRARDYDVLTTEEAGKDTASDEEQLAFATEVSRDGCIDSSFPGRFVLGHDSPRRQ